MREQKVFTFLEQNGISFKNYSHAPAFTCEQMDQISVGLPTFGHCKNLFLKDRKKRYYLLVARYQTKIDLKSLAKELEAPELRFARPDELEAMLGVTPGSVTLFALLNDPRKQVKTYLDASLFDEKEIGLHPLRNDMTTVITPADAKKFLMLQGREVLFFNE